MAYTIIPITQRPDGSLSVDLRNIRIRQGDYDLYQLSYTPNTDYSGYEPAVSVEVAFRRKDGQQTGWIPLTNIAKQSYKLDLKSRWFTNVSGNLYITFRVKQVSLSNVELILNTSSATIPIEPIAQFNPVEDLLPSSADYIIQDYTNQIAELRGTINDLENNKLDSDFSKYSEDAEISGREVIAINDTDGSVKTIKSSLLINNVETVNNISPDNNKNITITGSDIQSLDGLTVNEWLSQIGEAFQHVVIHSNNKLYDVDENIIQPETTAVNVSTTTSNVQDELNTINEKIRHVSKFKGVYKTLEQLYVSYPNGVQYEEGIYVILTSTDTVWIYDNDTLQWVNSGSSIGSVLSVNSQLPDNTGNILITGSDINSTVGLNGDATTKSVTQHLQDLYNQDKNIAEQINSEITNRTNADNALGLRIDGVNTSITTINNKIDDIEQDITDIRDDIPTDYVDLGTDQPISGQKTFEKPIKLSSGTNIDTISNTSDGVSIDSSSGKNLLNINETLETISSFNKPLAFDEDVPTKTSDITNDGDGTSPFATEQYVSQNGGKIDSISVNGVTQTIINKNVNIDVPTDYVPLSGATMQGALTFMDGNNIVLGTNTGQIVDSNNRVLFGYTGTANITVGSNLAGYLFLQGLGERITYKDVHNTSSTIAFTSDIPDTSGFANTSDLENYFPLSGGKVITGNIGIDSTKMLYGNAGSIKVGSSLIPDSAGARDFGDTRDYWRNLYIGGNISTTTRSFSVDTIALTTQFVTLTQAEYDALATKDANTYYFIKEE